MLVDFTTTIIGKLSQLLQFRSDVQLKLDSAQLNSIVNPVVIFISIAFFLLPLFSAVLGRYYLFAM